MSKTYPVHSPLGNSHRTWKILLSLPNSDHSRSQSETRVSCQVCKVHLSADAHVRDCIDHRLFPSLDPALRRNFAVMLAALLPIPWYHSFLTTHFSCTLHINHQKLEGLTHKTLIFRSSLPLLKKEHPNAAIIETTPLAVIGVSSGAALQGP